MRHVVSVVAIAAVTGLLASIASAQIIIPTVPIGNAGNAADPTTGNLYGSVAYSYNIGQSEVTNAQYAVFLNAKAATDTYALYSADMAGSFGGITRLGLAGLYTYVTVSGRENNPVNYVSFWDSTRFANWLHNGQGSGDTEAGAYTLTPGGISANTITRNAGWQWAVASENEWYKAAYHQPASAGGDVDNYWLYPTQSNTITTAQANYVDSGIGNTTPAGSFAANFYGAFDMGGNLWEWNDTIVGGARFLPGGSFNNNDSGLRASYFGHNLSSPGWHDSDMGFRVVQIPGPGSVALLAIGGLGAVRRRRHAGR